MKKANYVHSKNDKMINLSCKNCHTTVYNCGTHATSVICSNCVQAILNKDIQRVNRNTDE